MTIRIYVGTYAKYNNGSIAGAWFDLEDYSDSQEFYEAANQLHKDESDPELMFQDWECEYENLISESHIDPKVFELLELDEDDQNKVKARLWNGNSLDYALEHYEDTVVYHCEYEHQCADVALDIFFEVTDIPDNLEPYICKESVWADYRHTFTFVEGVGLVDFCGA